MRRRGSVWWASRPHHQHAIRRRPDPRWGIVSPPSSACTISTRSNGSGWC